MNITLSSATAARHSPCWAHRNVIAFFTNQQRWDTIGVHGNPLDLTPNFNRIVEAGETIPII